MSDKASRGIPFARVGALFIALLIVTGGGPQADPAAPAQVSVDALRIAHDTINVAALSPDGKRLYLGKRYSYDKKRLNLVALTLDDAGKVAGPPRYYEDTQYPLADRTYVSVAAIVPSARFHKLYVAFDYASANPQFKDTRLLSIYDTDADGEPVGPPRTYESGNANASLLSLALHPKLNVLYMGGWGWEKVLLYRLDEKGEPMGAPHSFPVGGQGKYQVTVSADGARLYLGTYPDLLEIYDIDAEGMPTGKPRTFTAGKEQIYLTFSYTPHALYFPVTTVAGKRLAEWPLEADGNPMGDPQVQESVNSSAMAADATQGKLWFAADDAFTDAFTGKTIVQGVAPAVAAINDDGSLALPGEKFPASFRQQAVAMAVADDGRAALVTQDIQGGFLGNRFKGDKLRITLLDAQAPGVAPATFNVQAGPFTTPKGVGALKVGDATPWLDMDPWLKDRAGAPLLTASTDRTDLTHLQLRLEVAHGDPENGGKIAKTMTDEVVGSNIDFFVPGYGYEPAGQRDGTIELLSEHAGKYLAAAQAVALKPEERPRQFMVSCYQIMGGQGSLRQLDTETQTAALMGFNTSNTYWWGNIPASKLNDVLSAHGITRRSLAVYNPPSYFDFDQNLMNPPALTKWAADQLKGAAASGGTPADVIDFKLADEPGWYYPTMTDYVKTHPDVLKVFRAYLAGQHLTPSLLGQASWDDVVPIGASAAIDLPSRRLFYWTMRFFPESAARGFNLARRALEAAGPNLKYIDVNLNNWPGIWYTASPNKKVANNPIVGPDSAMGSFDWLYAGRMGSNTPWTEDWFGDQSAEQWSLYGDLLRCEAMERPGQDFGAYVIGGETGSFVGGGRLKMLALVGHGAKALDLYTWGPEVLFPGNCWSESFVSYPNIADGLRMVGRGERLLFPGRPERGNVAILLPGGSTLWEKDLTTDYYTEEISSLHQALINAGYAVDFVDDGDIAGGALKARGYTTLYLTGPNVWQQAQDTIKDWVHNDHGTLVALPGAAVADEYNTPTTTLDAVLGLASRQSVREAAPQPAPDMPVTDTLAIGDKRFGEGTVDLHGPVSALTLAPAQPAAVLARLKTGGAGITASQYGNGRSIAYAFYPGWEYAISPDRGDRDKLPQGWGAAQMKLATEAVALANTPRSVTVDHVGVEACRLQSAQGIALVLLNWTGQPIPALTVTVSSAGKFHKVTSLDNGDLPRAINGPDLKLTLPLQTADVFDDGAVTPIREPA